jgi:hypothetical protein
MSAFMCSETHLAMLATFAEQHGIAEGQTLFDALKAWNVLSLKARYGGRCEELIEGVKDYRFAPLDLKTLAGDDPREALSVIIKLADCYAYQACEDEGYDDSVTAGLVERIIERAKALGGVTEGEAYDAAPWGL